MIPHSARIDWSDVNVGCARAVKQSEFKIFGSDAIPVQILTVITFLCFLHITEFLGSNVSDTSKRFQSIECISRNAPKSSKTKFSRTRALVMALVESPCEQCKRIFLPLGSSAMVSMG